MTESLPTAFAEVSDDVARRREGTRSLLAAAIILLLATLTIWLVIFVQNHGSGDTANLLVTGIFTPIIGIAGTVLGFYFGSRD